MIVCWEKTAAKAAECGWEWCSEHSCRRQLDERIPEAKQTAHRDPREYRKQFKATIRQRHDRFEAGKTWIGDHTQLDIFCRVGESIFRPFVTVWIDGRTSKVTGWCLAVTPCSATILAAMKMGLADPANMGGPASVWIDNGKDYDAWTFHGETKTQRRRRVLQAGAIDETQFGGIFWMLKIEAHFSQPYNPDGKASLERLFGTLHGRFDKEFPTYCGASPDTKPEGLEEVLKSKRHQIPLFNEVKERIGKWFVGFNHDADHRVDRLVDEATGERLAPAEAMRRWCVKPRFIEPASLDEALRIWTPPQSVGKHGVAVNIAGMRIEYGVFDPALIPYKQSANARNRKRVYVSYDVDDLSCVRVYDDKLRRIATVEANALGGLNGKLGREALKELMKQKRDYDKAVALVRERPEWGYLSRQELIAEAVLQEEVKALPVPGTMQLVATPFDGQAAPVELRKAAGAEHGGTVHRSLPSRSSLLDGLPPGYRSFDAPTPAESPRDLLLELGEMYRRPLAEPEPEPESMPLSPWSSLSHVLPSWDGDDGNPPGHDDRSTSTSENGEQP